MEKTVRECSECGAKIELHEWWEVEDSSAGHLLWNCVYERGITTSTSGPYVTTEAATALFEHIRREHGQD